MKIAFCFSGQLRTAEYAADCILRFIGDYLPNVDFFIHTWDKNLYRTRYYNSKKIVEIQNKLNLEDPKKIDPKIIMPFTAPDTYEVLEKINPIYKFQSIEVENYAKCAALFSPIYRRFQPHMYGWYKVNELKKIHEEIFQFKYDYVVKTRPDYLFAPTDSLKTQIEFCDEYPDNFFGQIAGAGRLNDVFFISKSEIMDVAAQLVIKNPMLNIAEHVRANNIQTKNSKIRNYSIYRPESIPTSSLKYGKCYSDDKDWYSTKGDLFRFSNEDGI